MTNTKLKKDICPQDFGVPAAEAEKARHYADFLVAAERERCAACEVALETLVNRCNAEFGICGDEAVIAAEAALERLYRWRTGKAQHQADRL